MQRSGCGEKFFAVTFRWETRLGESRGRGKPRPYESDCKGREGWGTRKGKGHGEVLRLAKSAPLRMTHKNNGN
jgi:hypothetical protein